MARKKAGKGHNSGVDPQKEQRAEAIRETCAELQRLLDERAAITEQMKSLRNTRIKGDLGMKISDFNVAFRLYQLEHEDRDSLLDTLRECFSALGVGDQLNWLDAVAEQPRLAEAPEPEAADAGGDLPEPLDFTEEERATAFRDPGPEPIEPEKPAWEQSGHVDAPPAVGGGRVFDEGVLAAAEGLGEDANPYREDPDSASFVLWQKGHRKETKRQELISRPAFPAPATVN